MAEPTNASHAREVSEFTITGVDRATGEKLSYPLSAAEAERFMLIAHGLDPGSYLDPADDERDEL
jgi:hypothetical protein